MKLDCLTERGQQFVARERTIAHWLSSQTGLPHIETPDPCGIDAIYGKDQSLWLVEIRCRLGLFLVGNKVFQKSKNLYHNTILVTHDKIEKAQKAARYMHGKYILMINIGSGHILWWDLTNAQLSTKSTVTRATCNGGTARRINAFIPLKDATITHGPSGLGRDFIDPTKPYVPG